VTNSATRAVRKFCMQYLSRIHDYSISNDRFVFSKEIRFWR